MDGMMMPGMGWMMSGMGLIGLLSLWNGGWRPAAALAGGIFLLAAGIFHALKKHRDREENIAMVSDIAIGALMLAYVLWNWLA